MFQRPCQRNYISSYIWHKSFIQTVKCSFLNQIVYQSFYGKEKFCVSACVGGCLFWRPCQEKLYLWYYLTQIIHSNGKVLFPWQKNSLLKFLERPSVDESLSEIALEEEKNKILKRRRERPNWTDGEDRTTNSWKSLSFSIWETWIVSLVEETWSTVYA